MKSITLKLILAFLCISLITVLVVVITTQRSTDREFNQFLLSSDQLTITNLFTSYYTENKSWDGVAKAAPVMMTELKIPLDEKNHLPFTLTNQDYYVILGGGMYQPGDTLLSIDQMRSLPIQYLGNNVGYLDIRSPMPVPEPVELKVKPVKVMKVKKEPTEQKQPKERAPNAWLEFLKEYRMKHPEKSYKQCLQDGKTEYKQ